ncbi:MAG: hypothetical protein GXY55_04680 [Phycisphaerae bacterium]|nr:hypothetical protein [Phycisphaerae bacterium]
METAPNKTPQAPVDEHLRCLQCDYNLTGLTVIAWVRLPRRHRWRVILLVLSVFILTSISSHTGRQLTAVIEGRW